MRRALLLTLASLLALPALAAQPSRGYLGFDANDYPGDALLPALHKQFAFVGYWLTNPPLTNTNPWVGKRDVLMRNGFGFLVVADGRIDKEILKSQRAGVLPAVLGKNDAAAAVASARREGFPPHTILFLDQEEGARMLSEQATYLLAWTEAVAASEFRPGVYASGHPVDDGNGPDGKRATITTIQDIRQHIVAQHLHPVAFWVIQDSCPPAPGCVVAPAAQPAIDLSGTPGATAWQFAQSPQTEFAKTCHASYRKGSCYAPGIPNFAVDLSAANSPDPSEGRGPASTP
jgi:hypothetical protein